MGQIENSTLFHLRFVAFWPLSIKSSFIQKKISPLAETETLSMLLLDRCRVVGCRYTYQISGFLARSDGSSDGFSKHSKRWHADISRGTESESRGI